MTTDLITIVNPAKPKKRRKTAARNSEGQFMKKKTTRRPRRNPSTARRNPSTASTTTRRRRPRRNPATGIMNGLLPLGAGVVAGGAMAALPASTVPAWVPGVLLALAGGGMAAFGRGGVRLAGAAIGGVGGAQLGAIGAGWLKAKMGMGPASPAVAATGYAVLQPPQLGYAVLQPPQLGAVDPRVLAAQRAMRAVDPLRYMPSGSIYSPTYS